MTGSELYALRKAAGWTQTQVADLTQTSLRSIMRWEGKAGKNKAKVPLHTLVIAHVKAVLEAEAARRGR